MSVFAVLLRAIIALRETMMTRTKLIVSLASIDSGIYPAFCEGWGVWVEGLDDCPAHFG